MISCRSATVTPFAPVLSSLETPSMSTVVMAEQPALAVYPQWTSYTNTDVSFVNEEKLFDQDGNLWMASFDGVLRWNFTENTFTKFTTEHGLASNFVTSLALDQAGSLWAGTQGGISHFDGQQWVSFTPGEEVDQNVINDIAFDAEGTLWAGGEVGVWRFSQGQWQLYAEEIGFNNLPVWRIVARANGDVCVTGRGGPICFDGQFWNPLPGTEELDTPMVLMEGPDDMLWGSTGGSLLGFDGKQWHSYDDLEPFLVSTWWTAPDYRLWGVSGNPGIVVWDGEKVEISLARSSELVFPNRVEALILGPDGKPWLSAEGKAEIYHFIGDNLETQGHDLKFWVRYVLPKSEGPFDFGVMAMAPDGALWFQGGDFDPVLARFDGKTWTYYSRPGEGDRFSFLNFAPDGGLWFGSAGSQVSHFDGEQWLSYTAPITPLENAFLYPTTVIADGSLWLGVGGGKYHNQGFGLLRFDDQKWTVFTQEKDGLAGDRITSLAAALDGSLWVGAEGGVSHYINGKWTTYTTADGLLDNRVNGLAVSKDGILWVGSDGGLSRFDGQSWQTYAIRDGIIKAGVFDLAVAADGTVWASMGNSGVVHFDGQKWTPYTSVDGLAHNSVVSITITPNGEVWFSTEGGISRYRP